LDGNSAAGGAFGGAVVHAAKPKITQHKDTSKLMNLFDDMGRENNVDLAS
jgi:hypothetical protein